MAKPPSVLLRAAAGGPPLPPLAGNSRPGRADPDELALARLAARQAGLLLTQMQRSTKPLETAHDAMLALIVYEAAA